jgi:branched-subunit amino acid aminotransferase/4-amino-4-deoxychorismate lyase
MIVFLNDRWMPAEQALVPVFDRGFLYGDGLFETIRVVNGHPFRWGAHWRRLEAGAGALCLGLPMGAKQGRSLASEIVNRNACPEGVLRINVSRGNGPRGYSPKGCGRSTFCMSIHPLPRHDPSRPIEWKLKTVSIPLPARDILSGLKNTNKLRQIMAKAEAEEAGADEAVLLTPGGMIAEGAASNLFWFEGDELCTSPLDYGILPGITREIILELSRKLGIPFKERSRPGTEGPGLAGVFCSLSSVGIAEAAQFDGMKSQRSTRVSQLYRSYLEQVSLECAG